jgi:hypothetical protein
MEALNNGEIETQEYFVPTKVSSRLKNQPMIHDDIYHKSGNKSVEKRDMNFEEYSIEKRTKLDPFVQNQALVSKIDKSGLFVFDELDMRGLLSLKETFRLANLRSLAKVCDIYFHFLFICFYLFIYFDLYILTLFIL